MRDLMHALVAPDLTPGWRIAYLAVAVIFGSICIGSGAWWFIQAIYQDLIKPIYLLLHREREARENRAGADTGRPSATYKDPDCWRDQVRSDVRARLRLMPGNGGAKR